MPGTPHRRHLRRDNKTNRKAQPNDFPFSVAFEISDKKAMEKGQGMRPAALLPPPHSHSNSHCLRKAAIKEPTHKVTTPIQKILQIL